MIWNFKSTNKNSKPLVGGVSAPTALKAAYEIHKIIIRHGVSGVSFVTLSADKVYNTYQFEVEV